MRTTWKVTLKWRGKELDKKFVVEGREDFVEERARQLADKYREEGGQVDGWNIIPYTAHYMIGDVEIAH